MRVEPVPYVYRAEDRRQRSSTDDTHGRFDRRRRGGQDRRARHSAYPWLAAAFGAHLLGQAIPRATPMAAAIKRAYRQPEARMPLRPRNVKTA
jgi:hypothetical protein